MIHSRFHPASHRRRTQQRPRTRDWKTTQRPTQTWRLTQTSPMKSVMNNRNQATFPYSSTPRITNDKDHVLIANISSQRPSAEITGPFGAEQNRTSLLQWILGLAGLGTTPKPEPVQPPENCYPCSCGLTNTRDRIVGGQETKVNEYPWMTELMYNGRFYCGASLINDRYVLTAAHCTTNFNQQSIRAVFLEHDRDSPDETKTFSRRIKKVIRNRQYSNRNYDSDIALLQLDTPIKLKDTSVKPVCLPPVGKSFSGKDGIVTGWGAVQMGGVLSAKLQEVTVKILSNEECRKTAYGTDRITDNMLCAGYPEGKKDSCQGDSGGPLHVINDSFHQQVGIVSWGEGCAKPNYPGVYTRVNRYITWIRSNTEDACYC